MAASSSASDDAFGASAGLLWLCFKLLIDEELSQRWPGLDTPGMLEKFRQAMGQNMEHAAKELSRFRPTQPQYRRIQVELLDEVRHGAVHLQRPASPTLESLLQAVRATSKVREITWRMLLDSNDPLIQLIASSPYALGDQVLIRCTPKNKCPRCGSKVYTIRNDDVGDGFTKHCFRCRSTYN